MPWWLAGVFSTTVEQTIRFNGDDIRNWNQYRFNEANIKQWNQYRFIEANTVSMAMIIVSTADSEWWIIRLTDNRELTAHYVSLQLIVTRATWSPTAGCRPAVPAPRIILPAIEPRASPVQLVRKHSAVQSVNVSNEVLHSFTVHPFNDFFPSTHSFVFNFKYKLLGIGYINYCGYSNDVRRWICVASQDRHLARLETRLRFAVLYPCVTEFHV